MNRIPDLTGERYGMLTVIKRTDNIGKSAAWLCKCDCGNEVAVRGTLLRAHKTTNCGCQMQRRHGEHSLRRQAEKKGISFSTVNSRVYKLGWTREEALNKKPRKSAAERMVEFEGEIHSLAEWASITGIRYTTLDYRLKHEWSVEETFNIPTDRKKPALRCRASNTGIKYISKQLINGYEVYRVTVKDKGIARQFKSLNDAKSYLEEVMQDGT